MKITRNREMRQTPGLLEVLSQVKPALADMKTSERIAKMKLRGETQEAAADRLTRYVVMGARTWGRHGRSSDYGDYSGETEGLLEMVYNNLHAVMEGELEYEQ